MWLLVALTVIAILTLLYFDIKSTKNRIKLQDAEMQKALNGLDKAVQDLKRDI